MRCFPKATDKWTHMPIDMSKNTVALLQMLTPQHATLCTDTARWPTVKNNSVQGQSYWVLWEVQISDGANHLWQSEVQLFAVQFSDQTLKSIPVGVPGQRGAAAAGPQLRWRWLAGVVEWRPGLWTVRWLPKMTSRLWAPHSIIHWISMQIRGVCLKQLMRWRRSF